MSLSIAVSAAAKDGSTAALGTGNATPMTRAKERAYAPAHVIGAIPPNPERWLRDRLARFDAPNNSGPLLRIDAMTDARLSASENTERSAAICGLPGKFRTGEKA